MKINIVAAHAPNRRSSFLRSMVLSAIFRGQMGEGVTLGGVEKMCAPGTAAELQVPGKKCVENRNQFIYPAPFPDPKRAVTSNGMEWIHTRCIRLV